MTGSKRSSRIGSIRVVVYTQTAARAQLTRMRSFSHSPLLVILRSPARTQINIQSEANTHRQLLGTVERETRAKGKKS